MLPNPSIIRHRGDIPLHPAGLSKIKSNQVRVQSAHIYPVAQQRDASIHHAAAQLELPHGRSCVYDQSTYPEAASRARTVLGGSVMNIVDPRTMGDVSTLSSAGGELALPFDAKLADVLAGNLARTRISLARVGA